MDTIRSVPNDGWCQKLDFLVIDGNSEDRTRELAEEEGANSNTLRIFRALRLIRMMRLLRLLKLAKLQQYVSMLEDVLNTNLQLLQIVKLMAGVLYLAHLLGCFWCLVGTNSGGEDHLHTWLHTYERWTTGSPETVNVWERCAATHERLNPLIHGQRSRLGASVQLTQRGSERALAGI